MISRILLLLAYLAGGGLLLYLNQPVALLDKPMDARQIQEIVDLLSSRGLHPTLASAVSIELAQKESQRARTLLAGAGLPRTPDQQQIVEQERELSAALAHYPGLAKVEVKVTPAHVDVAISLNDSELSQEQISSMVQFIVGRLPGVEADNVRIHSNGGGDLNADFMEARDRALLRRAGLRSEELRAKAQQQLDAVLGAKRSQVLVTCFYERVETDGHFDMQKFYSLPNDERAKMLQRLTKIEATLSLDPAVVSPLQSKQAAELVKKTAGVNEERGDTLVVDTVFTEPGQGHLRPRVEPGILPPDPNEILQSLIIATLLLLPFGLYLHKGGRFRIHHV